MTSQRTRHWWDAEHRSDVVEVVVEADSWPYPDGALRWLLRVAGATRVDSP